MLYIYIYISCETILATPRCCYFPTLWQAQLLPIQQIPLIQHLNALVAPDKGAARADGDKSTALGASGIDRLQPNTARTRRDE